MDTICKYYGHNELLINCYVPPHSPVVAWLIRSQDHGLYINSFKLSLINILSACVYVYVLNLVLKKFLVE